MGRLDKIELENFKSYGGNQTIGPFSDFTCIIGPNGSGKSNLMDAISFVLGVQSRHLRSSNLKELIYKKDIHSQPARRASVKLYYYVTDDDEIIKTNKDIKSNSTITFSRTISSAGVSSYRFNDQEVTFENYENILSKIGVLIKARNFLVFQGDIESIASKNPIELTKLIEHISGSDQLIEEYNEYEKLKLEAEESTIFNMQKKKMFVSQCREIKIQKDEADEYQKKENELNKIKENSLLFNIYKIINQYDKNFLLIKYNKKLLLKYKKYNKLINNNINNKKKIILNKKNYLKNYKNLLNKLKNNIKKLNFQSKLKLNYKNKLLNIQENHKNLLKKDEEMLHNNNIKYEELKLELDKIEKLIQDKKNEIDLFNSNEIKLNKDEMIEYTNLKEQVASQTSTLKAKILSCTMELKSIKQQSELFENQLSGLTSEFVTNNNIIEDNNKQLNNLLIKLNSDKELEENLSDKKKTLLNKLENNEKNYQDINNKLLNINNELKLYGNEKKKNKQDEKILETINKLKLIHNNKVYGKLIDLFQPIHKKYSLALSVAAGKLMDAIVVENKSIAAECIHYLKEQRIGICTFLPLDSLPVKNIPERLRNFGTNYKLCIDLIECSDFIKPAVSYALDSTLVCENLSQAQYLCYEKKEIVKVVTLQGHVINKSGALTGGSISTNKNYFEEKEIEKLKNNKEKLEEELANLSNISAIREELNDIEEKLRQILTRNHYNNSIKQTLTDKISHLKEQNTLKENRINEIKKLLEDLKINEDNINNKLNEYNEKLFTVEIEIFKSFSNKFGIENYLNYEKSREEEKKVLLKDYNELVKEQNKLSSSIQYLLNNEKNNNYIENINEIIKENDLKLEENDQSLMEINNKISIKNAKLEKINEKINNINNILNNNILKSYKVLLKNKSSITNLITNSNKLITNLQNSLIRNKLDLDTLLLKLSHEYSNTPLTSLPENAYKAYINSLFSNEFTQYFKKLDRENEDNSILEEIIDELAEIINEDENKMDEDNEDEEEVIDDEEDEEELEKEHEDEHEDKKKKSKKKNPTKKTNSKKSKKIDDDEEEDLKLSLDDDEMEIDEVIDEEDQEDNEEITLSKLQEEEDEEDLELEYNKANEDDLQYFNLLLSNKKDNEQLYVDLRETRKKYAPYSLLVSTNLVSTNKKLDEIDTNFLKSLSEISSSLSEIQPNLHASERYENILEKIKDINLELENNKENLKNLTTKYEKIKLERYNLFQESFLKISESLKEIYRDLTRSSKHPLGGNAFLTLTNTEEPYNSGIRFTAMPPMKRFRDMEQLSGGEKTIASLALLFAIHSYKQAPFFILDEVDAALDNVNVEKICQYIKMRSKDFQCLVISLKDIFYEKAKSLVGVCRDQEKCSSMTLTLDLTQYAEKIGREEEDREIEDREIEDREIEDREIEDGEEERGHVIEN